VNSSYQQSRVVRAAKSKWSIGLVILVVIAIIYMVARISAMIDSIGYSLTPPELPEYQDLETVNVNPTGWPNKRADWFHHASQGTATLPVPYEWLLALEAPKSSPWSILLGGDEGRFMDEFILRLGFIKLGKTPYNPDGLPIGIAKTESIYFPGIDQKANAGGFTCAACHTGQVIHDGKRFIIDGGPAMTDLGLLTQSLGAALGQTALSSNLVLLNGRFKRFAERVLGSNYNIVTRGRLKDDLTKTMGLLIKLSDTIDITEGFSRLDALNRIGNQVFSEDMDRHANYSPINAPVNYPHIWTTSWFDWVQYDGSIMQPLTRNTGEALGVSAYLDVAGPDAQRFASSVNVPNLIRTEDWLAGEDPFKNDHKFDGLLAPKWPAQFPLIKKDLAKQGSDLYQELCQKCHLPPINSEEFWSDKYWNHIPYVDNRPAKQGESAEVLQQQTERKYLHVEIIPLEEIGTDPAQANVLTTRTVDTTGLNLDAHICMPVPADDNAYSKKEVLTFVELKDSATSNFGLALGALVERTNIQWFNQNYIAQDKRPAMEGLRPNCFQVGKGYKARPLNGVWATAPFLHNGSIATLYHLLSPLEERPTFVELGNPEFDVKHVGIVQGKVIQAFNKKQEHKQPDITADYSDGRFVLDTRELGNHNTGHIFSDANVSGKIGRALSDGERMALIEYLKTL